MTQAQAQTANDLKKIIFDNVDPGIIYINNLIHFYDVKKILKEVKSLDELSFEDRIVEIYNHIKNQGRPIRSRREDNVRQIEEKLLNDIRDELRDMFSRKFGGTIIDEKKYEEIVRLLLSEIN